MQIKMAFTAVVNEDYNFQKLILSIIRACNEASAKKATFLVRKKITIDNKESYLYHYATGENLVAFLSDCYEIVAVFSKA